MRVFTVTPELCLTPAGLVSEMFIVRENETVVFIGTTVKAVNKWIKGAKNGSQSDQ